MQKHRADYGRDQSSAQPFPLKMGRRVKCFPLSYAMEGPRQARSVAAWLREPGQTLAFLRLRSCNLTTCYFLSY